MDVRERFYRRVVITETCHLWEGARNAHHGSRGYGNFWFDGKPRPAHRVAWFLATGQWPTAGMQLCHTCDVPICVNPLHLYEGTQSDNMRDRFARNPGRVARGDRHGRMKVTDDQVAELRRRYEAGGVSQRTLAAEYGISQSNVSLLALGKTRGHYATTERM